MSRDKYFAAEEASQTVLYLEEKSRDWFHNISLNGYIDKIRKSWYSYHGSYYSSPHEISFTGETGELVDLAVNHYRNIAQHMLVMVTSSRPSFQARAVNTDRKSLVQAKLANGLLEYYMREKRLERELKRATEYAIVLGSGYIKMEWNATRGEIYDYVEPDPSSIIEYDEDGNALDKDGNTLKPFPIYEGDVDFKTLSPYDIVFDSTKETSELHDWIVCRTFLNKYDLMAKYPEFADEIAAINTKEKYSQTVTSLAPYDKTVDIPVYEFFHKRTEALPEGRYVLYLNSEVVLADTVMPYRDLPLYRIAPSDILGTSYGYSSMWDLLPLQDAANSLYSTILTNQNAFGVQNILNPRGNDVKVNQLEGSLNFIEYNAQVGAPQPLNLTQTPPEIFNFLQMLERAMETVSGVNSVARGNPESSLKSGAALALVHSNALQFISGLQQSYIQLLEDVGTGLINMLKDFAKVPRIAAISGINNRSKMKEFSGDDLLDINRVVVDVGNALSQTTAGRVQMAEQMLQMGLITSPEQYMNVINTGNLDTLTEKEFNALDTIRDENERMLKGETPIAIATDQHNLHIREHKAVLSDQDLRRDPELVARALSHIQEHINLLRTTDPDLLALIGEQPLGPVGGSPVAPGNVAPDMPPASAEGVGAEMANPQAESIAVADQVQQVPEPARPAGDPNMPITPEEAMAGQAKG
jgi:hypothetical protein